MLCCQPIRERGREVQGVRLFRVQGMCAREVCLSAKKINCFCARHVLHVVLIANEIKRERSGGACRLFGVRDMCAREVYPE